MGALDGGVWVCAECRSINNNRAKQCYNCRTPQHLAAVDPATIEGTGHGKLREIALPSFHSPKPYAAIASILILATAGLQLVLTIGTTTLLLQILDGTAATDEQLAYIGIVGLTSLAVAIVALVCWSLWLSRAVTAMPALGLGYPAASGTMAFVENFLPGLNLLRVPAIVRDVARRIEPGEGGRGEALIFAAWIALLGGFVVPRVGAFVSGLSSDSTADVVRSQLTLQGIATGFVLVGAIFLVALIWWIEERIDRRREAQLAEIDAATAGATEDSGDGGDDASVPYGAPRPAATAAVQAEGLMRPIDTLGHPAEGLTGPAAGLSQQPEPQAPAAEPQTQPAAPSQPAAAPAAGWSWGGTSASPLATSAAPAPQTGVPAVPLAAGWDATPIGDASAETDTRETPAPGQHRWDDWAPSAPRPAASNQADGNGPLPTAPSVPDVEVAAAPEPAAAGIEAAEAAVVETPAAEMEAAREEPQAPAAEELPDVSAAQQATPETEPAMAGAPEPLAEPEPEPVAEPEPEPEPSNGAPHLTIRVTDRGMVQAEMAGEVEPVILEDLTAYAEALANAGGTAEILVSGNGGMGKLIATRAQRIMAEAGVEANIPD
jgi:hypothetical protein